MNKDQYNGVYDYIFNAEKSFLENMGIYYGLIAFVFVGIITSIFTPIGIVMILLAIVINSIFYEVHKIGLAAKFNAIFYIRKIFLCAYELFKIDFKDLDFHVRLKNSLKPFKKMMFFMNNTFVNEIEGFLHFFKVVFLID